MSDRNVRMYSPTHRFNTSAETAPTSDLTVAWSHEFQKPVRQVAVWDDTVYLDIGESIVAIGRDGNSRWRFNTDGRQYSSPAVVDGTVYFGGTGSDHNNGTVYALDAATGGEQWRFKTDWSGYSSPAKVRVGGVVDGTVFGSCNGTVYALDAATGSELWAFQTDGKVELSLAVKNGTVYVGASYDPSVDGAVYALDAATGSKLWTFRTEEKENSAPAVVDGTVYVGTSYNDMNNNAAVYALDTDTGREQWAFRTNVDETWVSSPVVVDGIVLVGSRDSYNDNGAVYALDDASGTQKWAFRDDIKISTLVVADGTVYVGNFDGIVYAMESTETEASKKETDQKESLTKIYEKCSNCDADLSEYDNLNFCPECGVGQ